MFAVIMIYFPAEITFRVRRQMLRNILVNSDSQQNYILEAHLMLLSNLLFGKRELICTFWITNTSEAVLWPCSCAKIMVSHEFKHNLKMVALAQTMNPITLETSSGFYPSITKSAFSSFQKALVTLTSFPSPA